MPGVSTHKQHNHAQRRQRRDQPFIATAHTHQPALRVKQPIGSDSRKHRHHRQNVISALEMRYRQAEQNHQAAAPEPHQQLQVLIGPTLGPAMAQRKQGRKRQRHHREVAVQAQLEIKVKRLTRLIQTPADLHLEDFIGKRIATTEPRKLHQQPPARGEQHQADNAVDQHLPDTLPRLAQCPIHTHHRADFNQPQRPTYGETQDEQREHRQLPQPRPKAFAGVQQVETAHA